MKCMAMDTTMMGKPNHMNAINEDRIYKPQQLKSGSCDMSIKIDSAAPYPEFILLLTKTL